MDSHLTEKLIHACEQVRRCRADNDSQYLVYWFQQREDLLEQLSANSAKASIEDIRELGT